MISTPQINKIVKCLLCISFPALTIGLLSAWNTPVTGYEASIYSATPTIFWIFLIFGYLIGTLIIVLRIFNYDISATNRWAGIILLVFCSILLASLCIVRGYFILNISGDTGTHLGILSNLIETGSVSTYYPAIYIGPAMFQLLSGISIQSTISLYPLIYLALFILGVYVLSREIFPNNEKISLITLLIVLYLPIGSAPFLSGYYPLLFLGMQSTIRLIPLVLFIIFRTLRTKSNLYLILSALMCISLVFYHPMASLMLILLFIALVTYNLIMPKIRKSIINIKEIQLMLILLSITLILFFIWSWGQFGTSMVNGIVSLISISDDVSNRGIGELSAFGSLATGYGYSLQDVLRMASINILIYLSLAAGGIVYSYKYLKKEQYNNFGYLYSFTGILAISTALFLIMNIGFKYSRFLDEIYLAGIISTGFVLYYLGKKILPKLRVKKIFTVLICIGILMIICGTSVLLYHPSPISLNSGYQSTEAEYIGAETLLPHIDYNKNTTGITFTGLQRYVSAFYGSAYTVGSYAYGDYHIVSTSRSGVDYAEAVPYHFGYDTGSQSLSDHYAIGDYIFITAKDQKYYQAYYPEMMKYRWTQDDFKHLTIDKGLEYVYDNGGLGMYMII